MFAWWNRKQDYETHNLRIMCASLHRWIGKLQGEVNELKERVQDLERTQKSFADDLLDVQADLTLIHNIEGYEDWREEIGKPVSKPTDIVK